MDIEMARKIYLSVKREKDFYYASPLFMEELKREEWEGPYFVEPSWKHTGWLLERLPEWEDKEGFKEYYALIWAAPKRGGKYVYWLPWVWLTSPTILPEKLSEYIKWRDEK